jgi:hypothetical protein
MHLPHVVNVTRGSRLHGISESDQQARGCLQLVISLRHMLHYDAGRTTAGATCIVRVACFEKRDSRRAYDSWDGVAVLCSPRISCLAYRIATVAPETYWSDTVIIACHLSPALTLGRRRHYEHSKGDACCYHGVPDRPPAVAVAPCCDVVLCAPCGRIVRCCRTTCLHHRNPTIS